MIRRVLLCIVLTAGGAGLSGCLAGAVAGAAVGVAATTVKTGVKATGAVVGGTADVLTTSDQEACVKEMRRRREDTRVCFSKR